MRSIKFRDKLYKQYQSKPLNSTEKVILKSNLRVFNMILKKDIREAKSHIIITNSKNTKGTLKRPGTQLRANLTNRNFTSILYSAPSYSRITRRRHCGCRGLLVRKRVQEVNSMASNQIKVNSQTILNEKEITSNNYFTDIGGNLADKIDTSNKHPFDHYFHSPSISKFHFKQTNPNEIISVIHN